MTQRDYDKSRASAAKTFESQAENAKKRAAHFAQTGNTREAEKARALAENAQRIADKARANIGKK